MPTDDLADVVALSDLHLGSPYCDRRAILATLKVVPKCRRLVLIGDVLDGPDFLLTYDDLAVLREISRRKEAGCEVVWIEGNHDVPEDSAFTAAVASGASPGELRGSLFYHVGSGGKTFCFTHGHQFDHWVADNPVKSRLLGLAYGLAWRVWPALGRWVKRRSLAMKKCHEVVMAGAETILRTHPGLHAVVAGHTHESGAWEVFGRPYVNLGCWVEPGQHCYAVIRDGSISLVKQEG